MTESSHPRGLQLNPRFAPEMREALTRAWDNHREEIETLAPGAIGILTSGSTQSQAHEVSIVILSAEAVKTSALAVNRHLGLKPGHVWGLMLPMFHVGGYMIPVRAMLSGTRVVRFDEDWRPESAVRFLAENGVTHLSWVPTQVYDVVAAGLAAPPSLQAVIVGGGRLDPSLKRQGQALGWPLLESYGMTEFCSQIATELAAPCTTADVNGWMKVLSHVEVATEEGSSGRLMVRSASCFSGRLIVDLVTGESNLFKREGKADFWLTQDRVEVRRQPDGAWLKFVGRVADVVKVLGENVDLARVRRYVNEALAFGGQASEGLAAGSWEIVALPDARREHEIVLVVESSEQVELLKELRQRLGVKLLPIELPTRVCVVREIPRSSLGKVKFPELRELLTEASKI